MGDKAIKLSIIIPVYNSQETIGRLVDRLIETIQGYDLEIILVNDYSTDNSHEVCLRKYESYPQIIRYFKLSRNFGEHNAVLAGLNYAAGDYIVTMDDDFQNPPEEVSEIVDYMHRNRFDVVYSYYEKKRHSWFRNMGSWFNNRVVTFLLKKPSDLYLSSFKCINRFLADEIIKYHGPYPYIDGLILRVTRNIGQILVRHEERVLGKSNYTVRKLISLWLNMFINFSVTPLRISFFMGMALTIFGILLIGYFTLDMYVWNPLGEWPSGWASLLVIVITFSGTQLISLGLIGEYLGKLFLTENGTPQFIIREHHKNDENNEKIALK
jgi:undecaprenyl-phosphate 4-deoxy-4-formamido-L-arabinose transferase